MPVFYENPLIWVLAVVAVFGFLAWRFMAKRKGSGMPTVDLTKETKRILKLMLEIKPILKKGFLRQGIHEIGSIVKYTVVNWKAPKAVYEKKSPDDDIKKLKAIQYGNDQEFLLLAVTKRGLISKFMGFLGFWNLFLVDREAFVNYDELPNAQDFIIKEKAQFWNMHGCNYLSGVGKHFITEVAHKVSHELGLQTYVSFTPRMTYLEVRQAKFAEKAKLVTDLEKKRWSSKLERLDDEI